MARKTRKKTNVKTAPRRKNKALRFPTIKEVLTFIGKPLFLVLFYIVVGLVFIPGIVGKAIRVSLQKVSKFRFPKVKKIKVKIKTPKIKILKIKPPKLDLPKIRIKPIKISFPKTFPKVDLVLAEVFFIALLVTLAVAWILVIKDLPSPKELVTRSQSVSTKIYDRNGILLYKIFKDENRTIVTLSKIPLNVRLATLAAEDAEFYSHPGFSVRGIIRSVFKNIEKGELSGGSTITQQLVKNALLSPQKTIVRKIREVILAMQVEATFTKDQILEMYLNEVSYGGTAYGIQEASQAYFGKDVDQLTVAEAALLAGLPKSPTRFSPFGSSPQRAIERQREVLYLMEINGFLTKEERAEAEKQELVFVPDKIDIKAPHFVMHVRDLLVKEYGEEVVEKGGLEVVTTLDYNIQQMAEEVVKTQVEKLSRLRVGNGSAIVLNPKTGEILAMVGSKDFFDIKNDGQVNVATSLRQPGSSIKVVNYAYALSNGYTPASILEDTPVIFNVSGQPPYTPKNYDNTFRGKITVRSALAESRNIPAVRLLASYGVVKMIELGEKMGISTWENTSDYGLSLTLGGGEVKLIELAQVFATIANYGKKPEISSILKVTNYKEKVLEESKDFKSQEVLDPRVAFQLIDILKDNSARSPSFGSRSALVVPKHPEVAVKTGTSNNLRDNLTVGFNQDYLVAVWVGNNDGSPMSRIASGITGAAPIWNEIMRKLLAKSETKEWETPKDLVKLPICTLTGTLTCQGCPTKMEWFLKESTPQKTCSSATVEKIIEENKSKQEGGQILPQGAHDVN